MEHLRVVDALSMSDDDIFYIPHVYLSIAIYFFATALATLGHVQMKLHSNSVAAREAKILLESMIENSTADIKPSSVNEPEWWKKRYIIIAIFLYVTAGLIDLSVNRAIPFYIRACFAALDIPIYAIFAYLILNEVMDVKQAAGVLVTVLGCGAAVYFSAHSVRNRTREMILADIFSFRMGVLIAVTVPVFIGCFWFVRHTISKGQLVEHDTVKDRLLLLFCAVFSASYTATWASLLVRLTSELAYQGIDDPATIITAIVLVLMCIAQMGTIADMMTLFKSIISMPPYLLINATGIVIYSAIIFLEHPQYPLLFGLSMIVAFLGVVLIVHKAPEIIEDSERELAYEESHVLLLSGTVTPGGLRTPATTGVVPRAVPDAASSSERERLIK
jgi:hypothetical protein